MMKKKMKKIKKEILHLSIFINFVIFFYFLKLMPIFTYKKISRFLGVLSFTFLGSTKKRIINNLKISYGNQFSVRERKEIGKDVFSNIIFSFCELVGTTKFNSQQIIDMAEIEGEEILKETLKIGKGIVGVCSHMGNFPLLQYILVKKGYPANVIIKAPSASLFAKFCDKLIRRAGVTYISKQNARKTITEAQDWMTAKRGILSFYLDQHASNGTPTQFFGKKVFAPNGAALFTRKYNCLALGVFSYRMKNGKHKIIIEGPYPLKETNNINEDLRANTSYFMERVEHYVKIAPEQWFSWLHRRFR
jgi:KDO2-lipid IV(A) lauroyltransferase